MSCDAIGPFFISNLYHKTNRIRIEDQEAREKMTNVQPGKSFVTVWNTVWKLRKFTLTLFGKNFVKATY